MTIYELAAQAAVRQVYPMAVMMFGKIYPSVGVHAGSGAFCESIGKYNMWALGTSWPDAASKLTPRQLPARDGAEGDGPRIEGRAR